MREFKVRFIARGGREEFRTISALSEMDAAMQLILSGGTPLHIQELERTWFAKIGMPIRFQNRINALDIALFAEQLGEMLKASVTVEQALDLLARESSHTQTAELASRLLRKVRAGCALSHAFAEEKSIPRFFSGFIRGSERGGQLADGLRYLADYLLRQVSARGKIIAALTYPAIVVATSILAFAFVMLVVIPEFVPLFAGDEKRLPAVTRVILWLSYLMTTQLPVILLIMFGGPAVAWLVGHRVLKVRQWIEQGVGHWPLVSLLVRLDVAKSLRVAGTLLTSRIDASEALSLAHESATWKCLKLGLVQAARQVREGRTLSDALRNIDVIPDSVSSLIALGERTGDVGMAIIRAANLLEVETNRRIDQFISLINPIAVVILGISIAILISGVMLGILSANQFALR